MIVCGLFLVAALIFYRNDIFQSMQDPGQPFQTYEKPQAPDYSITENWMDIPDLSVDPFSSPTQGDVFVVIPVLYKGGDHWNLPVTREYQINKLNQIIRPNYVAPFKSSGRVFAPFYRQASLYTAMTNREDARKAQNLAYSDVKRAFRVFLEQSPPERPIILAGYGQGASHVQRLLIDFFDGELKARLAAAYVIDHPTPVQLFETDLKNLKPCETETDTGCVIGWGAFMPGDGQIAERFATRRSVYEGGAYKTVDNAPLLCMNPLLWSRQGDYAPRRLHKGGLAAIGLEPDAQAAPLGKQAGAQCENGLLYVDRPKSRVLRRPIRIGGQFRTLPSNLFYEDIRVNAVKRVEALKNSGILPERVEKLDELEIIEINESPVTPVKE